MNVLIIVGHPRGLDTLCGALAQAYKQGADAAGATVRLIDLAALEFDVHVRHPSPNQQALEPDLAAVRGAIEAADHLVFSYPTWWGTYPALLKGLLDRVLLPGWAFEKTESGTGFAGMLAPRTAEIITTMDTPGPIYAFLYRAPGQNAMRRATLDFCGLDVVRHSRFGAVLHADEERRNTWLAYARRLGERLESGPRTLRQRAWRHVTPWLQALRLQFYPMTFIAYWLGAAIAPGPIRWDIMILGYATLAAIEAATVFSNDYFDAPSDARNKKWGPFNGGSRVLHDGSLTPATLYRGAAVALSLAAVLFLMLGAVVGFTGPLLGVFAVLFVLAVGYTVPPLKLSWRGLGEIDVALTHSLLVVLAGLVVQTGTIAAPAAWIVAAPLFLAILPAIILSNVADYDADITARKRTIPVLFGIPAAFRLSGLLAIAAALAMFMAGVLADSALYGWTVPVIVVLHALWIARLTFDEARADRHARRIDRLMVIALSYILWFCVTPLVCWTG